MVNVHLTEVDPLANLLDNNLIGAAILQCLIENDPEGIAEIIEDISYALDKANLRKQHVEVHACCKKE